MDENAQSFSHFYGQPESPKIYLPKPANSSSSGLTLVIPSLKSLKASQSANRSKYRSTPQSAHVFHDADLQEKRAPRPVKLKPLKEVLSKLTAQLKKKDDYAFFLHPVDVANVPGYSDIVKRPMDLGTMSDKVSKGKYRSLEDFASDFRLVTNNAKMFNPPGTIYHTEADRLEVWGLDHISKAASTVIQYETDWNIEIEKDDDGAAVNVDEDDEENNNESTAMDVDATSLRGERSVSVASQVHPGPSRRGPRGPYKKHGQSGPGNMLSESLEVDGGLPGSKDGLGSFPAGSDWAKTMVALKLKGKRYKTKKERMRIEREGPPLLADGSLDYTEMEDPFSVLSFFVPDPPSRPHLVPLYPPLYHSATATATAPPQSQSYPPQTPQQQQQNVNVSDPSSSQIHTPQSQPQPQSHLPTDTATPVSYNPSSSSAPAPAGASSAFAAFPAPTSAPLDHAPLSLPFITQLHQNQTQNSNDSSGNINGTAIGNGKQKQQQQPRRRHWTIVRNATSRQKGKEREDYEHLPYGQYAQQGQILFDAAGRPIKGNELPGWQMPREAHAVDFGSLSVLAGALAEEMRKAGVVAATPSTSTSRARAGVDEGQGQARDKEQDVVFDLIRDSLDCESALKKSKGGGEDGASVSASVQQQTNGTASNSSLLAGGYWTDKRAAEAEEYVRDLVYGGVDGLAYVRSLAEFVDGKTYLDDEDEDTERGVTPEHGFNPTLGMPLAKWVEANVVDPLTEGRHSLLRETALELARQHNPRLPTQIATINTNLKDDPRQGTVASQVSASLRLYPAALVAMSALMHIRMHKIDMGSLIKTPNELFLSEEEWIGKVLKERRRERAKAKLEAPEGGKTQEGQGSGGERDADAVEVEEPEQTWAGVDASLVKDRVNGRLPAYEQEGPEELNEVLEYVANVIGELDARTREKKGARKAAAAATAVVSSSEDMQVDSPMATETKTKAETEADPQMPPAPPPSPAEDSAIRNLRLNLLALAKRAPLDTIARLPKDLVPEHIRHFVPTLGSTG